MLLVVYDPRLPKSFLRELREDLSGHIGVLPNTTNAPYLFELVKMELPGAARMESPSVRVSSGEDVVLDQVDQAGARSQPFVFKVDSIGVRMKRCLIVVGGEVDRTVVPEQVRNLAKWVADLVVVVPDSDGDWVEAVTVPGSRHYRVHKVDFADDRDCQRMIQRVGKWLKGEPDDAVGATVDKVGPSGAPPPEAAGSSSDGRLWADVVQPGSSEAPRPREGQLPDPVSPASPGPNSVPPDRPQIPISRPQGRTVPAVPVVDVMQKPNPPAASPSSPPAGKSDEHGDRFGRVPWKWLIPWVRDRRAETTDPPVPVEESAAENQGGIHIVDDEPQRRSANGNIVVEAESSLNKRPWHSENWMKLADRGPGRDLEIEYGGARTLRVMAGSARGTRHQYYGEANEDAFALAQNDHFVVAVVSDGVGAADFASYGSSFMSHCAAREVGRRLAGSPAARSSEIRDAIVGALQTASDSVQQWSAGSLHAPPVSPDRINRHALSATITVCVVPIDASDDGTRQVVCGYVGDSPCYTLGEVGWTLRSKVTKDGEIMDLGTSALPNPVGVPVVAEFAEFAVSRDDSIFVMTDGIGTSLGSGRTPVGRWLAGRLRNPVLSTVFLSVVQAGDWVDALTFDRQGEDDDRTLVMLYDYTGAIDRAEREIAQISPGGDEPPAGSEDRSDPPSGQTAEQSSGGDDDG